MSKAQLLMHEFVTHDTRRFIISRPDDLDWEPGQGLEIAIDNDEWRDEGHPFTPTSLPKDRALEFIIKRYSSDGFTEALHEAEPGTQLILSEPFGSIRYQGPGVFIAAGTGVTPFIGILRSLAEAGELEKQRLILSNKSERDLICGDELRHMLGERAVFTFTREHDRDQSGRRVDAAFLQAQIDDLEQQFYVCGPEGFVKSVNEALVSIGVHPDRLVYER